MNRINHKGFTLTELLIVISIGIFLVLIVLLNVLNTPRGRRNGQRTLCAPGSPNRA